MKLSSFRLAPAKAKDRLTIILSIAAFALSAFNFYTTGLRVTDDIRVVAGEMPVALPNFAKKQFSIQSTSERFVFINAGTRSAIISGITLGMAQPDEKGTMSEVGCNIPSEQIVQFDTAPFVLRPGDMVAKDGILASPADKTQNTQSTKDHEIVVPFSVLNMKSEKVRYKLCVDIAFTTPSIEFSTKTIDEFEDELDESVMGYVFTRGDKKEEHRPVQLIKRSEIVFFD